MGYDMIQKLTNYEIDPETGCWMWKGNISPSTGYAKVQFRDRHTNAHRIQWMAYNGYVNANVRLSHSCDCRTCVNPEHIYVSGKGPRKYSDPMIIRMALNLFRTGVSAWTVAKLFDIPKQLVYTWSARYE